MITRKTRARLLKAKTINSGGDLNDSKASLCVYSPNIDLAKLTTLLGCAPTHAHVFVTREILDRAIADVKRKKNLAAIPKLRLEAFVEGSCAQVLHIGPFSEEGPTIEEVHQFIASRGKRTGKHHEIYLSDIRKADPTKWKTIIRQPMQ
jgi:hypothetical protein